MYIFAIVNTRWHSGNSQFGCLKIGWCLAKRKISQANDGIYCKWIEFNIEINKKKYQSMCQIKFMCGTHKAMQNSAWNRLLCSMLNPNAMLDFFFPFSFTKKAKIDWIALAINFDYFVVEISISVQALFFIVKWGNVLENM